MLSCFMNWLSEGMLTFAQVPKGMDCGSMPDQNVREAQTLLQIIKGMVSC